MDGQKILLLFWHFALAECTPWGPTEAGGPNPTTNSALIIWKGQEAAARQLLGPWAEQHQDHNFRAFSSLKRHMEPQYSHQVYSASRIRLGSLVPSCVLVFLVMNRSRCLFPLICQETVFFSLLCGSTLVCCFICPSLLPSVLLLVSWASNETDLQGWTAVEALAGVSSIPGVWVGGD